MHMPLHCLETRNATTSPAACSRNWLAAAELYASPAPREPLVKRIERKHKFKGPRK